MSDASYNITNNQQQKDQSEVYQLRSDAQMEINSDREQDNADQLFIIRDNAVFSEFVVGEHQGTVSDEGRMSVDTSEIKIVENEALFSDLESEDLSIWASEKYFIALEEAAIGDT